MEGEKDTFCTLEKSSFTGPILDHAVIEGETRRDRPRDTAWLIFATP